MMGAMYQGGKEGAPLTETELHKLSGIRKNAAGRND